MLLAMFKQFNWVDVFAIILLLRIGYIATKFGLPIELFKILGTVSSIYLSLHYYTGLSDFIRSRVGAKNMPLEFLDFLSFLVLAIIGYLAWAILRQTFCRLFKMEAAPKLNKWGGLALALVRVYLLAGLVIFMLVISSIGYFKQSVQNSYSGRRLFKVAPQTYSALWNNLMSKFMPKEKFNKTILEVQENLASP